MASRAPREDGLTEVVIPTSSLRPVDAMSDHGEQLATLLESHCMSMRRNVMVQCNSILTVFGAWLCDNGLPA